MNEMHFSKQELRLTFDESRIGHKTSQQHVNNLCNFGWLIHVWVRFRLPFHRGSRVIVHVFLLVLCFVCDSCTQ